VGVSSVDVLEGALPPREASVYDYCFDQASGAWMEWMTTIPEFNCDPDKPFAEVCGVELRDGRAPCGPWLHVFMCVFMCVFVSLRMFMRVFVCLRARTCVRTCKCHTHSRNRELHPPPKHTCMLAHTHAMYVPPPVLAVAF